MCCGGRSRHTRRKDAGGHIAGCKNLKITKKKPNKQKAKPIPKNKTSTLAIEMFI